MVGVVSDVVLTTAILLATGDKSVHFFAPFVSLCCTVTGASPLGWLFDGLNALLHGINLYQLYKSDAIPLSAEEQKTYIPLAIVPFVGLVPVLGVLPKLFAYSTTFFGESHEQKPVEIRHIPQPTLSKAQQHFRDLAERSQGHRLGMTA